MLHKIGVETIDQDDHVIAGVSKKVTVPITIEKGDCI